MRWNAWHVHFEWQLKKVTKPLLHPLCGYMGYYWEHGPNADYENSFSSQPVLILPNVRLYWRKTLRLNNGKQQSNWDFEDNTRFQNLPLQLTTFLIQLLHVTQHCWLCSRTTFAQL